MTRVLRNSFARTYGFGMTYFRFEMNTFLET
jgi:hypothetical protein